MKKIAIVGAGPSALFAAKTILESSSNLSVIIFEQGKALTDRFCAADQNECLHCPYCDTLEGVGGAGLFSDGKLVLDLTSGGKANGINILTDTGRHELEDYIKETFIRFDGVSELKGKPNEEIQESVRSLFNEKMLEIKFYDVLHMGTKNLKNITGNFVQYLIDNFSNRISICNSTRVTDIRFDKHNYTIITNNGIRTADVVIAAVGKSGASWLKPVLEKFGCTFTLHDFFFGFRMETPAQSIKDLLEYSFDPKIFRIESNRKVKIHCVCRQGEIRYSQYCGYLIVGGHSPSNANNAIETDANRNANFNILVSFDKNHVSPKELLSRFQSENSERVIAQKLGDFIENTYTSQWGKVIPQNKSMVFAGNLRNIFDTIDPDFSDLILRFLASLSEICPGVMDNDNVLYAPAIEWDMDTVNVDDSMETRQKNLFAIGDGAGLSQGIVYSAATGIIAAKAIVARFGE